MPSVHDFLTRRQLGLRGAIRQNFIDHQWKDIKGKELDKKVSMNNKCYLVLEFSTTFEHYLETPFIVIWTFSIIVS